MKLTISMYIVPPLLSLFASLWLAVASALRRGWPGHQNLQLAILFLFIALLPTAFICHHLIPNETTLLTIERSIHFFYVFTPLVYLVAFHSLLGVRRSWLVRTTLVICTLLALATPTDYYFSGLRRFDWGYIARGEIVFHLFGAFGFVILGYTIWIFWKSLARETNPLVRRRNKYFLTALSISACLTLMNIPAISGYDFYPMGNFAFIPLVIFGYAALKFRLLGFRDIINRTAHGFTVFSLFLVPNLVLFFALKPFLLTLPDLGLILVLLSWFALNLIAIKRIQTMADRTFGKSRINLERAEITFFESIFSLRNLAQFERAFARFFHKHLAMPGFNFYVVAPESVIFQNAQGLRLHLDSELGSWLTDRGRMVDRNLIASLPQTAEIRQKLIEFMDTMEAAYLIPVVHDERLMGLVFLPQKSNRKPLSDDEVRLIDNITRAAAVSLANAAMYQRISDLRDDLVQRTAELSAEIAQREHTEEKYRILLESIDEGFYEVDLEGTLLSYNDVFADILGAGDEDLTGLNFREFLEPQQADEVNAYFRRIFNTGAVQLPMARELIRRDDQRLFAETRASVMYDKNNNKVGFRGIIRDVTEVRMAELEQARLQQQLMNAKKMEALGTLAGGVAHDLNNILSGIASYPDLLLEDMTEEEPLYQALTDIKLSGEKAAAVVNDLLTLARRGVPVNQTLGLNQIVQEYLESPEHARLQKGHPEVVLETNLEAILPGISGSSVHLSKALMNLVTNAYESIEGSGRVTITTGTEVVAAQTPAIQEVAPGRYLTLVVADDGAGIPAEDLSRIYEPFFTSKKMGRSGSGLGMTVVWGTVEDHKGTILVDSRVNGGTRFKLYFPVPEEYAIPVEEKRPVEDYMGCGESVLVVDDVGTQRIITARMLEKLGYRPVAVPSGEEAVEYLRNTRVDILVLDMIMDPGIDGLETYRRIKEIHPDQKAIIASGYSETDRVREVLRLGAGGYLKKPYRKEDLGRAIQKELQRPPINA